MYHLAIHETEANAIGSVFPRALGRRRGDWDYNRSTTVTAKGAKILRNMAKRARSSKQEDAQGTSAAIAPIRPKPTRPLIFISHDHRDSELAEQFSNLLTDASGGTLKSFRSSDKKGRGGIEFGSEWYGEIMSKIDDATDVVALLTPHSIGRSWILFEAGVAKGKLGTPVFGVVVGVAMDQAVKGPFAQFQNSTDDEDSLTKLVLQLIKRNPEAEPREEAVRKQVAVFRGSLSAVSKAFSQKTEEPSEREANDAAKLFEEVKLLFRQFSERLNRPLSDARELSNRRFLRPRVIDEIASMSPQLEPALVLLMLLSVFREDAPWIYEASLDLYRASQTENGNVFPAAMRLIKLLDFMEGTEVGHYLVRDGNSRYALHHASKIVSRIVGLPPDGHQAEAAGKPTGAIKARFRLNKDD
jgi:hypothetical protein